MRHGSQGAGDEIWNCKDVAKIEIVLKAKTDVNVGDVGHGCKITGAVPPEVSEKPATRKAKSRGDVHRR